MADTPDPLAAELAAIAERAEQITSEHDDDDCDLNGDTCTGHDAERLLAAVAAVLDLHRPDGYFREVRTCDRHATSRTGLPPSRLAAAQDACPDCRVAEGMRCWQHGCPREWPCPTYAAISAALLGQDAGKDGTDAT